MAQTILSERKSTNGSPYGFYTVEVTPSNRTANSVKLAVKVKSHLQYSDSYIGTGYSIVGHLIVNETEYDILLKASSEVWSGTTVYTASKTITVSGLNASATSLSGVKFSVTRNAGTAATLSSTSCSNITIDAGNSASSFTLSDSSINLGDSITATISRLVSTNYHRIVASFGGNTYTFTSNAGTSATLTFSENTFGLWFGSTEKSITVTLTMTTFNSSGTSLGTASEEITLIMTDDVGKPSTPTAVKTSETTNGAVISLTRPSTYKYGATFSSWEVTVNEGTVSVDGDVITATVNENKTVVVSIQAVDSRGLKSDAVKIIYHIRKRGVCLYKDGTWKHQKVRLYNGAWVKVKKSYVFYDSKTLVSSDNNTLLSSDGLVLKAKGGEKWLIIR